MVPSPRPSVRPSVVYQEELAFVVRSLRRLGIGSADLEDLAHDVFMTAFRRLDRYDTARPIRPWLFGIAFRLAADFRRLVRHDRERPIASVSEPPDDGAAPDEAAAQSQDRRLVLAALGKVDLARQPVFIMHDIEGLPMPEIAHALDLPLGTAYSRLRQARAEFTEAVRAERRRGSP